MTIVPKQAEADEKVITYWFKKRYWNYKQFAALYCGVNPYALEAEDDIIARTILGIDIKEKSSHEKIAESKREAIKDLETLIVDRLNPEDYFSNSPEGWKEAISDLDLPKVGWMKKIQTIENVVGEGGSTSEDKPLKTRERDSYLLIIAVLCSYSDIELEARGVAKQISDLADEIGVNISDDTVSRVLKQIPEALEKRKN